jgi:hypothetical protein
MKRIFALCIGLLMLAACSRGAAKSEGSADSSPAVPSTTTAPAVDPQLLLRANPCTLVTPNDVMHGTGKGQFLREGPDDPKPAAEFSARVCKYIGLANTVWVQSLIDTASAGPAWKHLLANATHALPDGHGSQYTPIEVFGDDAFYGGPFSIHGTADDTYTFVTAATISVRKGTVIVQIHLEGEPQNVATRKQLRDVAESALRRM